VWLLWVPPICNAMCATELMALIMLAEDDPLATYLVEDSDGMRILWRLSEGAPEDEAMRSLVADASAP
jgi:hypothetical protein